MKNFIIYIVIFVAISLAVSLIVELILNLFGIDPETQKMANYLLIGISACTAGLLTPMIQKKFSKKKSHSKDGKRL